MSRLSHWLRRCGGAAALCCVAVSTFGPVRAPAAADVSLRSGDLRVTVDPRTGGRITGLQLGGHQILTGPEVHADNFGSTFWLSPQSLWSWPPVAAHDSAPYTLLQQSQHSVQLQSASGAGARVVKGVRALGDNLLQLDYRIVTETAFAELAAWEITRVARSGLAFAPVSRSTVETVRGEMDFVLDEHDILWLPMNTGEPLTEGKVIANGSAGWLAYADGGYLYLKIYPRIRPQQMASGEGDIELYLSDKSPYLELEIQSAAQALQAGEQLNWRTHWLMAKIPSTVPVAAKSAALVEFVNAQLQRAGATIESGSQADIRPGPEINLSAGDGPSSH
ncbi:protein of unknown function [Microbulbifer donghaiensis]|uniref:DUF4380 domain-containing protein n=1 Tax=Microbulbifer donghaiensis TaxID=494016 RepID=A0A1M5B666_9GAMM|nr:DUF4380 domain-containing protein [Microbulbifer donghaiensis]SHF37979.1 protein of unknown function [Microbulbifer donghaiensis]